MSYKVILFDLDGTLLPMDQETFLKGYFGSLAKHLIETKFDGEKVMDSIMAGTLAMINNDGFKSNEEAFWNKLASIYGDNVREKEYIFEQFYLNIFPDLRDTCGFNKVSRDLLKYLKSKGYKTVLATNPLFPAMATHTRIKWAGLDVEDFDLVTTYENSNSCKPNLLYYENILKHLNVNSNECIMVGNDVGEDMVASKLGMDVYLILDDLINRNNENIDVYKKGYLKDFLDYIKKSEIS